MPLALEAVPEDYSLQLGGGIMADIAFVCPHCQQEIEAPGTMAGGMINCPSCEGLLRIPGSKTTQGWLINFNCMECGQNIELPSDAVGLNMKCPGCGHRFVIPSPAPVPPSPAPDKMEDEKKGSTARIELPPEGGMPMPQSHHITIKRSGDASPHMPEGFASGQPKHGGLFGRKH